MKLNDLPVTRQTQRNMQKTLETEPQEPLRSEIIAMALSDEVPFRAIEQRFGINEPALKRLMCSWIRPARYRAGANESQIPRPAQSVQKLSETHEILVGVLVRQRL